jgi:adenylate cyclase
MRLNCIFSKCILVAVFFYCGNIPAHARDASQRTDSLKNALGHAKEDTNKVKLLIRLSEIILGSDTLAALQYANAARSYSVNLKWNKGICCADLAIAEVYEHRKKYEAALPWLLNAVAVAAAAQDRMNEVLALKRVGLCYHCQSRYTKALEYYKRYLESKPAAEGQINILGNMGLVYSSIGDYPLSLLYYDSSLKVLKESIRARGSGDQQDTSQIGGLLITIGDVYMAMSDYDKALENFRHALSLYNDNPRRIQHIMRTWALGEIGKVYQTQNNMDSAIAYYTVALTGADSEIRYTLPIQNELANVYLQKKKIDTATAFVVKALKTARENNLNEELSLLYVTMGKILTAQKRYDEAVKYLKDAIDVCKKNGALVLEKNAWEALKNTYHEMKQPTLELNAYEHFIAIRDSVYNIASANAVTRLDAQLRYEQQKEIADAAYDLKMQKQRIYTYAGYGGLLVVILLSFFIYRGYSQQKKANVVIRKANHAISKEQQKAEMLLLNILPGEVATELKAHGNVQAKLFDHVTVMLTDFVNFTEAGERLSPEELVSELHSCFKAFDEIISKYNIEKIKTVGDAYLAVSGLPNPNTNHAADIIKAGIECRDFMIARKKKLGDRTFSMRIGVNSGTVVAGIVGVKKFAYDIWGDTVNTTARMEQYSEPDKINISQATYEQVKEQFTCTYRGEIDAKHKGKMRMYFVEG